eukprot:2201-Heterococcus_DN1.PRE.1
MSAVLVDACKEHGIEASAAASYALQYKRTTVDLSQPFRLTGIPQNTTLDLKEVGSASGNSTVRVGVKLPSGKRLQGSFAASTALDAMLRELLTGAGMDCTELSSDSTTLQFMRSTYSGAEGLAATTLASIGLSGGSAMFTLTGAEGTFSDTAATAGAAAAAGAGASSATESPTKAVLPAKRQVEESSSSSTGASPAATHAALPPPLLHVPAAAVVAAVTHPEPYAGSDAPHAEEFMKPAPRSVRSTSSSSTASAAAAGATAGAAAAAAGADVMDVDDDAASSVTSGGGDFDRYSTVSVAGSDASALLARMQDVDAMAVVDSSANSNYNSSSSSSGAAAMEADEQQQQHLDDSAMGLAVCEAALETLKSSHFDADVLDCVLTLLKYVDGVAQRPGDARTRSIKLSNAAYKQKHTAAALLERTTLLCQHSCAERFNCSLTTNCTHISEPVITTIRRVTCCVAHQVGRLQGGAQFLQGLGFQSAPLEGSLSHEVARSPEAHTALVLAQHREDSALLKAARDLLCTEAVGLGVSPSDLPPAVRPVRPAPAVPAAPFDPYKSMV